MFFKKITSLLVTTAIVLSGCASSGTGTTSTPATSANSTTGVPATVASNTNATTGIPTTVATNTSATTSPTTNATATTVAATTDPQTYTDVYSFEVTTLNYLATTLSSDIAATSLFVDGLVMSDKFGNIVPDLAESWKVSDDGLTWTFKIRPGVKWYKSDGTEYAPVTANDFLLSAKYILHNKNAKEVAPSLTKYIKGAQDFYDGKTIHFEFVGVSAPDDNTVVYTLTNPVPYFLSILTSNSFLPVNEKFLREVTVDSFGTDKDKILYNGAYLLKSWTKDMERVCEKNKNYFFADRIHIPMIKYSKVQNLSVGVEMYKQGEVSSTLISGSDVPNVIDDPAIKDVIHRVRADSSVDYCVFNFASKNADFSRAISNLKFRQAFQAGFDKSALLSLTDPHDPKSLLVNTLVPADLCNDSNKKDYQTYGNLTKIASTNLYDPSKAKELMAQAKQEFGSSIKWPITIKYPIISNDIGLKEGTIIKEMFEKNFNGYIKVNLDSYAHDKYFDMVKSADWDITTISLSASFADPSTFLNATIPNVDIDYGRIGTTQEGQKYGELLQAADKIYKSEDRFAAYAKAEEHLLNNVLIIPIGNIGGVGGAYEISKISNPYDAPLGTYGISKYKFLDLTLGNKALTKVEFDALRATYEKEKANQPK